jgi:CheY-like chemotaxis protein
MSARRKKILLVDDSSTMLLIEQRLLKDTAYDLVTAQSGEESLEKARLERPDLILMDVVMPGMGGLEACARLREREPTRDIPILVVTSQLEADRLGAPPPEVTEVVIKPFDRAALLARLRAHLGEPA